MINLIEKTGTGSVERTGTGSIERTGTGSIEHSGTGSIEHTGTGSIEHTGTGRIARGLALAAAMTCLISGAAIADTASYATSHGTIDVHTTGAVVRVSWHYDDGANREFLVGEARLSNAYGMIKLKPASSLKIEGEGTGSSLPPNRLNRADNLLKVEGEGTGSSLPPNRLNRAGNLLKVEGEGTGSSIDLELIFTDRGVEAVATRRKASKEVESIVLDLDNRARFSEAVVYVQ